MADENRANRVKASNLDHTQSGPDEQKALLFRDGSLRCAKCVAFVELLGNGQNPFVKLDDEEDDEPSRKKHRRRRYGPTFPCVTCGNLLISREYHKLGDHLLDTHESAGREGREIAIPREGCCFLCLLVLQFKCTNGFLPCTSILKDNKGKLTYSGIGVASLGHLQIFSHAIEEPVSIDRYLPQGFKQVGGNTIRIVPGRQIHAPSIRSWLLSCETDHDCDRQLVVHSKAQRVSKRVFIDIKHQKLVTCPYDCRYLALSYVWGGIPQLLLTKSKQEKLLQDGALKTFESEIPQVIKDAMQFVSSIGENLLWVDSLCILQDDELLKHDLIMEMASIYSGAVATILAASGENAAVGLAGVRENSRRLPHLVEIPGTGLHLTYRLPLNLIVDNSSYNTRGWTFQERLLSQRCIFFTDTQVFFECQKHLLSEDRFGHQTEIYPFSAGGYRSGNIINQMSNSESSVVRNEEEQLLRYSKLVEEYCHKNLTYVDDILDAFAGISAAMEHICGWKMAFGIPEHLLDRAILWEPEGKTVSVSKPHIFDLAFSSYGKDNAMVTAKSRKLEVRRSDLPSWSWAAWIGGIRYNEWTASHLQVLHSPFQLIRDTTGLEESQATPNKQSGDQNRLKSLVLSFSSECLPASVFSLETTTFRTEHDCLILNTRGERIGTIPGVEDTFAEEFDNSSVDIVLLSASKLAVHRFRSREDKGYPSFFDIRYPKDDWHIFTVMFVRWNKGFAKRVALAYIHRDAWKEAGPQFKPLLLA